VSAPATTQRQCQFAARLYDESGLSVAVSATGGQVSEQLTPSLLSRGTHNFVWATRPDGFPDIVSADFIEAA